MNEKNLAGLGGANAPRRKKLRTVRLETSRLTDKRALCHPPYSSPKNSPP
ncbi:hypothetical protein MICAI_2730015 [Microcystis sp. T1-4]|nr:hypothetical protein MICAI_2730015 [Microcystis sp. T1-4]